MKQFNILGIGPTPTKQPDVATAHPFMIHVQTKDGTEVLSATFEAAKELKKELEIYLHKFRDR